MTVDQINYEIFNSEHMENIDTNDISDGCHTFGQLYFQRMMLFATLVNLFPEISWKTKRHEEGEECFGGGWFLVTIDTPSGAYGYHYEMKYWDMFNCMELYKAKPWDGYTEENVDRLFSLVDYKKYMQKLNKDFSGFILKTSERQKMFNKIREQEAWDKEEDDDKHDKIKNVNIVKEFDSHGADSELTKYDGCLCEAERELTADEEY